MIKREFVKMEDIDLYTKGELAGTAKCCHFPDEDGNLVRVGKSDGKSLERHLEGIEFFSQLYKNGVKIFPPLLLKRRNGRYQERDGFKRLMGMKKAGAQLVEAFTYEAKDEGKYFKYEDFLICCRRGGMPTKKMRPVEYGEDWNQEKGCGKILNLYVGKSIKLEYRENIHLHTKHLRISLGRRDFDLLAEAFANGKD